MNERRFPAATRADTVWRQYERYLAEPAELTLAWTDAPTGARGWLVVNRLRNGAAGGGTRMRPGLDREEVTYLAKVMELKFSVSGPPIGGAKSGIDFDPADPRKRGVLRRWFGAVAPYLRSRYGTAGDLNVDAVAEVAPLCAEAGLVHPQEGIARGHFRLEGETLERRMAIMEEGLRQEVEPPLGVASLPLRVEDLVTGYGVAAATLRLLEQQGREPGDLRFLMEGFGNVGGAAALYLARAGARAVGFLDDRGGTVRPEGWDAGEVEDLLRKRKRGRLPPPRAGFEAQPLSRGFHEVEAEIFVSAAASGTLDGQRLERLASQGVDTLVCGANHPFRASRPGDVSVARAADARFAVLADMITNCGAARAYARQMKDDRALPAPVLFAAVRETIEGAVDESTSRAGSPRRGLLTAALAWTLERTGRALPPDPISPPSGPSERAGGRRERIRGG